MTAWLIWLALILVATGYGIFLGTRKHKAG